MAKNKGNNGAVRVKYVADNDWARDSGVYLAEGTLVPSTEDCVRHEWLCDGIYTPYTLVRFDRANADVSVNVFNLELI